MAGTTRWRLGKPRRASPGILLTFVLLFGTKRARQARRLCWCLAGGLFSGCWALPELPPASSCPEKKGLAELGPDLQAASEADAKSLAMTRCHAASGIEASSGSCPGGVRYVKVDSSDGLAFTTWFFSAKGALQGIQTYPAIGCQQEFGQVPVCNPENPDTALICPHDCVNVSLGSAADQSQDQIIAAECAGNCTVQTGAACGLAVVTSKAPGQNRIWLFAGDTLVARKTVYTPAGSDGCGALIEGNWPKQCSSIGPNFTGGTPACLAPAGLHIDACP